MHFVWVLTLYIPVSSADNFYKHIGARLSPTKCQPRSGSNLFDTDLIPEFFFLEKLILKKKISSENSFTGADDKNSTCPLVITSEI